MLTSLLSYGHVISVLLIAAGIALLVWNISVQAGRLGKHRKRKVALVATPSAPGRQSEVRVETRDFGAR